MAVILNFQLTASITFHDVLHGFCAGRGTGTATLEGKILQQLAAMSEEVLYVIFMYLNKLYDTLEMYRCLEILYGCGVGPRSHRILRVCWDRLRIVAHAGGYYGTVFQGFRGVAQGGPMSPTILNVVVDAVV